MIFYKDGAKRMRPILTREEYLQLRDSERQRITVQAVRNGMEEQKKNLLQMNRRKPLRKLIRLKKQMAERTKKNRNRKNRKSLPTRRLSRRTSRKQWTAMRLSSMSMLNS